VLLMLLLLLLHHVCIGASGPQAGNAAPLVHARSGRANTGEPRSMSDTLNKEGGPCHFVFSVAGSIPFKGRAHLQPNFMPNTRLYICSGMGKPPTAQNQDNGPKTDCPTTRQPQQRNLNFEAGLSHFVQKSNVPHGQYGRRGRKCSPARAGIKHTRGILRRAPPQGGGLGGGPSPERVPICARRAAFAATTLVFPLRGARFFTKTIDASSKKGFATEAENR
jgi:hypothetical protein